MRIAPVVIFVYNRPIHTKKTIQALLQNSLAQMTDCYIFADGPRIFEDKTKNARNQKDIHEVRDFIANIEGFKSIQIEYSDENRGLARSIVHGVTKVVNTHGKVIVVEDDIITTKEFLGYMNEALELYERENRVGAICGYMYPLAKELPQTLFVKNFLCWGWATWSDRWEVFNPNGQVLLDQIENQDRTKEFDIDGSYFFTQMLRDQISGHNNSWAIRYAATLFLSNYLCLCPGVSLINNIGFDGTGTHSGKFASAYEIKKKSPFSLPIEKILVVENLHARKAIYHFFKKIKNQINRKKFWHDLPFKLAKKCLPVRVYQYIKISIKKHMN
ncbi:MAG: glycosyltransferase family 2 protein [Spirochaetia bacterium]